jgi:hypothetical protein
MIGSMMPAIAVGQELEPRNLANVPVGANFLVLGYGYSEGNILLDPSVPIEDLNSRLHSLVGGYVRTISFFGLSSKVDIIVPYAKGDWEGALAGVDTSTSRSGMGDVRVRLSVNFVGAPALDAKSYRDYQQRTIVGASLQVFAPVGQYNPSKLINLGTNRWTFRPQLGISRKTGAWFIEGYISTWFFTKNSDFYGGNVLNQKPLLAGKIHVIRSLKRKAWVAVNVGYAFGGRTLTNGEPLATEISTWRFGATLSLPLGGRHSLKLAVTSGVRIQRGSDFDAVGIFYQFLWF